MSSESLAEIEIPFLVLRYAHTRVSEPAPVRRLAESLERFGQLAPVVVVAEARTESAGMPPRYVLLDGYRRVAALGWLRRDTVLAQVWEGDEAEALLRLLAQGRDRPWEAIEQAQLLAELRTRFGLSQERLASRIGRDLSWVSRRLSLVDSLPAEVLSALRAGRVSTWAATRVLAPLARANPNDARRLVASLSDAELSTRELALWWAHYGRAHRAERDELLDHPAAWVRALRAKAEEASSEALAQGPEGQVLRDARTLGAVAGRLVRLLPSVLSPAQLPAERCRLVSALRSLPPRLSHLNRLLEEVTHAPPGQTPADPLPAHAGGEPKPDRSPAPGRSQDRAPGAPWLAPAP